MKNVNNMSPIPNESEVDKLRSEIDRIKQWFSEHPDRNVCNIVGGLVVRRDHIEEDLTTSLYGEAILQKHVVLKEHPPLTNLKEWQSLFRVVYHTFYGNNATIFGASCVELHESTEAFRRFAGDDIHKPVGMMGTDKYNCYFLLENFRYKFENGDDCDYILNVCPEAFYYEEPTTGYVKVFPFLNGVLLNSMQVYNELQGKGHGTRLLKIILDRAQKTQTKVYLLPAELAHSKRSLNQIQLRCWYARHGFVDTLPIYVPVLRLSHYKGGLTHIVRTRYMCFAPVAP